MLPPGPFQPSKNSFFVPLGRFSHQKIACLPSWDISAIKQRHFCFPGAFQPSKSSIVGPWAVAAIKKHSLGFWGVSAIKKRHFWPLGRFNHQRTACLPPWGGSTTKKLHCWLLGRFMAFQPSKNSMFGSWGVSTIKNTHIHTQHPPVAINTKCN